MRLLLAHGADVNAVAVGGQSPLHVALVRSDRSEIVALLLHHGADVNKTDKKGRSPLQCAVTRLNLSAVRLLLEYGADPNNVDSRGHSPLYCAMRHNKKHPDLPGVLILLLDHGADLNKVNWKGRSPLHYAVKYAPEQTRLLLERGADPNKVDDVQDTPLLYALFWDVWKPKLLMLLLEHGADANLADSFGYSPLNYAVWQPCCKMVACLLKHGADPNLWKRRSPLQDAVLGLKSEDEPPDTKRELFESVRLLMKAGALVELLGETDQDLVKTICERQTWIQTTPALVPAEPTPNITPSLPQRSSTESDTTGPAQPPPTSEPPRDEMEEGWTKVERRKGKGKTEKKVEHRAAGGGPTWADIARGGGASASVNVFIGRARPTHRTGLNN
jgi:hypothetical protein